MSDECQHPLGESWKPGTLCLAPRNKHPPVTRPWQHEFKDSPDEPSEPLASTSEHPSEHLADRGK